MSLDQPRSSTSQQLTSRPEAKPFRAATELRSLTASMLIVVLALATGCEHPGQLLAPLPSRPFLSDGVVPPGGLPPTDQGDPAVTTDIASTTGNDAINANPLGFLRIINSNPLYSVGVCFLNSAHGLGCGTRGAYPASIADVGDYRVGQTICLVAGGAPGAEGDAGRCLTVMPFPPGLIMAANIINWPGPVSSRAPGVRSPCSIVGLRSICHPQQRTFILRNHNAVVMGVRG